MDWARDNAGLSESDQRNIFKYEPKKTTVIKAVESNKYCAQIWTLESHDEWEDWIENEIISMNNSERGLILVLAKRRGEPTMEITGGTSINEWLKRAELTMPRPNKTRRKITFAGLVEKGKGTGSGSSEKEEGGSGSIRTLPFSQDTFKVLSTSLCTHGSIARAISRADVPLFSSESVLMAEPAYVYTCRSSHAWSADLALSSTYLIAGGVSCSILYGCPFATEESIIKRLNNLSFEVAHPMLLPGIFAELEVFRHTKLVESMTNAVENKIFELDLAWANIGQSQDDVDERNAAKRDAWLDLSYLRNGLISWDTQIGKMIQHLDELEKLVFVSDDLSDSDRHDGSEPECTTGAWQEWEESMAAIKLQRLSVEGVKEKEQQTALSRAPRSQTRATAQCHIKDMQRVSAKIGSRLSAIRDEYDEKIRDCTMRVEGMAMATQWSHGETNVEIALATNQDSKVMRSIALVTMLFLPGTFFATIFSMTFFQWTGNGGRARVSSYLWIYVLVTVVFTAMTVGLWYYFVMIRKNRTLGRGSM